MNPGPIFYKLFLVILWFRAPERVRIEKVIEGNAQPVADELDRDDARIAAAAVYDILQRRRRDARFPRKRVDVIPMRRAKLLNT